MSEVPLQVYETHRIKSTTPDSSRTHTFHTCERILPLQVSPKARNPHLECVSSFVTCVYRFQASIDVFCGACLLSPRLFCFNFSQELTRLRGGMSTRPESQEFQRGLTEGRIAGAKGGSSRCCPAQKGGSARSFSM